MWRRVLKATLIMLVILIPVGSWWLYWSVYQLPPRITIAAGAEGGRYRELAGSLQQELQDRLGVEVSVLATDGSLENLLMLRAGKADFAFYQPGTTEILRTYDPDLVSAAEQAAGLESTSADRDEIACVANLYMQPAHFIVRADAHIERAGDLNRRPVSVGLTHSGDYAMSLLLLEHLGLGMESVDPRHLSFDEIVTAMVDDSLDEGDRLDATCHTVGSPAPFLQPLFESGKCRLFEIPHAKALTLNHVFLSEYTIPAGLYNSQPVARPPQDVSTVAVPAQLLTRTNVSSRVIEEITNIVLDKRFARQNDLRELLERGEEFARSKPEFSIHPAAQSLYNPEFDIHLIESWEAAYSLTASLVIAGFFGFRAIRRNSERKVEHRLDRYIRALLEIEQRQVSLDQHVAVDDTRRLQELLDEVTVLRRNALREFSIHELNEDRGADCFLEMCHGLSNKINAKISRQRLDAAIQRLIAATVEGTRSNRQLGAGRHAGETGSVDGGAGEDGRS